MKVAAHLAVATQRPSHEAMSTDVRDNCRVRIGMGCESLQQASMVMGADQSPLGER